MVGDLGAGRNALTILAPLAAMLLSLPAFAGDAETDAETCSPVWEEIGLPSIPEDSAEVPVTVCHKGYILGHSTTNRTPDWAIERVTRAIAEGRNSRPGNSFSVETLPDGILGSSNDDYKNSGFDRGHQAPSNDFKSSLKLMEDTFFYTNVVPQVGKGFNQGIWKQLEALVRKLAIDRDEIYVITGPVYQEKKPIRIRADADACGTELNLKPLKKGSIGSDVAIPAALYKIIYDPRLVRVNAYVLPNFDHRSVQDTERDLDYLKRYRVGLGTVEKLTGFTFMTALDDRAHRILAEECPDTMLH
jgi:endonuclease G